MATLNFETAMESVERTKKAKRPKMVIALDGREMTVKFPSETKVLVAMAAVRRHDWSRFMGFMLGLFGDDDQDYLMTRLDDDEDPFEVFVDEDYEGVTLFAIFQRIMEEMSARPTSSPSGSAPSQRSTGRTSTGGARVKAKRRATSPSTGS